MRKGSEKPKGKPRGKPFPKKETTLESVTTAENSTAAQAMADLQAMVQAQLDAANAPLTDKLTAEEVGQAAAFLSSPLASGITGSTVYVDKGYAAMGKAI